MGPAEPAKFAEHAQGARSAHDSVAQAAQIFRPPLAVVQCTDEESAHLSQNHKLGQIGTGQTATIGQHPSGEAAIAAHHKPATASPALKKAGHSWPGSGRRAEWAECQWTSCPAKSAPASRACRLGQSGHT